MELTSLDCARIAARRYARFSSDEKSRLESMGATAGEVILLMSMQIGADPWRLSDDEKAFLDEMHKKLEDSA
jgi:hypothetical protein